MKRKANEQVIGWESFPNDIIKIIVGHLDFESLRSLLLTSKTMPDYLKRINAEIDEIVEYNNYQPNIDRFVPFIKNFNITEIHPQLLESKKIHTLDLRGTNVVDVSALGNVKYLTLTDGSVIVK